MVLTEINAETGIEISLGAQHLVRAARLLQHGSLAYARLVVFVIVHCFEFGNTNILLPALVMYEDILSVQAIKLSWNLKY